MGSREPVAGGFRWSSPYGALTVTRPLPHVELIRAEGYADAAVVAPILEHRDRMLRECGSIALFDDLELMTGFHSAVRVGLTEWARVHKARITAFHILTRSTITAMGVTVANVALGGHICAHARRESFEASLDRELNRPEQWAVGQR